MGRKIQVFSYPVLFLALYSLCLMLGYKIFSSKGKLWVIFFLCMITLAPGMVYKIVESKHHMWSSHCCAAEMNLRIMRLQVWSLPLLSGLRILRCRELWCRSQTQPGSRVAVALTTSPIGTLAWEPPYAEGEALEKTKYIYIYISTKSLIM